MNFTNDSLSQCCAVDLSLVQLDPIFEIMRNEHISRVGNPEAAERSFSINEWRRYSFIGNLIGRQESILEIGTGRGYFTRYLAETRLPQTKVASIDIVDRPRCPPGVDFRKESVTNMSFSAGSFETVVCCEVLEHLSDEQFLPAVEELYRVCNRNLLISVPFLEPMPSKYHFRSFGVKIINEMFFDFDKYILFKSPVMRVPWILMMKNIS